MARNINSTRSIDQVSARVAEFYAGQPTDQMDAEELEEGYALYCDMLDQICPDYDAIDRDAQYDARQAAFSAWIEAMQRIEDSR